MFSKSSKSPASVSTLSATGARKAPFSLIGADVVVRGDLTASVDLHLDGGIEGDLTCAGLVQGQESVVRGHVIARTVRLAGTVHGMVTADEVVIERSARISGDVFYTSLTIENGAQVEGRLARKDNMGETAPAELKIIEIKAS